MSDLINQPPHYRQGKIECVDSIQSMLGNQGFADYCRGQVLKYLWRAPHKGAPNQDLFKAQFYMNKLVGLIEKS